MIRLWPDAIDDLWLKETSVWPRRIDGMDTLLRLCSGAIDDLWLEQTGICPRQIEEIDARYDHLHACVQTQC